MQDDRKAKHSAMLMCDTNEELVERFIWYINNYNPIDFDRCDDYELVKAEVLRRMGGTT